MKIKNILTILVLGITVSLIQACNTLDLKPTDSIDPSKAFRNLDDLNMGVLGAYAPLNFALIEISAIVSDELMLPTENTVSNTVSYRWMYNSSYESVTGSWNTYYQVIDRINRVLEALPNINAGSGQQSRLDQYKGELLALRAYAHFELLRAYATSYDADGMGVPYMKAHELGYPARPTVAENFKDINADLQEAKNLIPESFNDNTRVTRKAVAAIQARAALYAKDWANAASFASEVISKTPLASKTNFSSMWKDGNDAELLWKLARVPGDAQAGASFYRQTGDIVLYAPSFKLVNLFDQSNDIRFSSYITYDQARKDASNGRKSAYLVKKYDGNNSLYPGLTAIKLFRTGEMYLIRAEALVEQNSLEAAAKDLNDLRSARINGYTSQTFAGKQQLLDAIRTERLKELAFEGHRFFDLKRGKLPVERNPEDAINASGATKLLPTAAQYCFPLPADEMSVNKNIKQNPNY